ncbi:MAG: hypothetical protein A3E36_00070 [Candidatus Andersenbacteria bacterium RIFCSPHIGHO2_12_FULL_45_11b]|uniref:Recombinase domain-containing protein n=1 Tax=Candidatus Andersenbacteria bacterium RIFCSPHIGHO2_12_FULL_45_11b TaxID=1797282 RepID=A0A1G1X6P9_9BACT|nr:MAG: hypothetical protein A3E36_00070 [Candidatus Andersenbacteria bacterium RIFCSPHIGHO2_12_FULL_45_11b]
MTTSPNIDTESKKSRVAALYARVSTARQEKEATVESQIEEIKDRISGDGHTLSETNTFVDDGWTGTMLERPELDKMRDAAASGRFQILYVYDRGRLSRELYQQEVVINELKDKWVDFISLHDAPADTPEQKVLQMMQGVFHQYERIKIAERFRRGKLYKAKTTVINGHALYGYEIVRIPSKTNEQREEIRKYIVSEDEAEIIRKIYEWFTEEDIGKREITRRLYQQGILSPKGKKRWGKGTLNRILSCDTYAKGVIYYNKSEAVQPKKPRKHEKYKKFKKSSRIMKPYDKWIPYEVPPIIDEETYGKSLKKLDYNKKYATKNRKNEYLLSGLVWCECGSKRVGDPGGNGNLYYRCADRIYKFPIESNCTSAGVNARALEPVLWEAFVKYLANPSTLKAYARTWLESQSQRNHVAEAETERIQAKVKRIQEEEERYNKAYGAGAVTLEQLQSLKRETSALIKRYKTQISQIEAGKKLYGKITSAQVNALYKEAQSVLQSLNIADKKKVLRDSVDKIIVAGRKSVEVWIHLPTKKFTSVKEGLYVEGRNRRPAKRWEIDAV